MTLKSLEFELSDYGQHFFDCLKIFTEKQKTYHTTSQV